MNDITPHGAAATIKADLCSIGKCPNIKYIKHHAISGCAISFIKVNKPTKILDSLSSCLLSITPKENSRTGEAVLPN